MIKNATVQGVVRLAVLVTYFIQLVFLQLFIRLEPTMFGLNISALTQSVINLVVRYTPVLVLLTTVFLIYTALYVSSAPVRFVSLIFLMAVLVDTILLFSPATAIQLYGNTLWLLFNVVVLLLPEVLLTITATGYRNVAVAALAVSGFLASSFYVWSFLSRITFSIPPIVLIPASIYAFAASFAALSVYTVIKFKQKWSFYVSFAITAFLTAFIVFFTYSNILVQKIINMVLQTSLGAPTPLPWFFPLFSLMIFLDVYSFLVSVKRRSLSTLSVAAGATMIFTSVYLPYNMLYVQLSFSGALLIYLGLADQTSPKASRNLELGMASLSASS